MTNYAQGFMDKYNAIYWYVFAAFLLLNVIDWLTGWYKSYKKKEESSRTGLIGIVKKLGYWAIILVAFIISGVFVHLGNDVLGINLAFLTMIGWWVVAMLIVNEARSILENLVECGYNVPAVLVKGLAVTEKIMNAKQEGEFGNDSTESQKRD